MLHRFLVVLILIQIKISSALGFPFEVSIKGQSLCMDCSVAVQSSLACLSKSENFFECNPMNFVLNLLNSSNENSSTNTKRSLFVFRNNLPFLQELEQSAISSILNNVGNRSAFAKDLVTHARNRNRIRFHIYYQLGLDAQGKTSLYNSAGLPTFEIERKNPHEFWGFYFNSHDIGAHIFFNEYQHPWNAWYTLVHELFHLYDAKVSKYVAKKKALNEPWTTLDYLAIEYRAQYAELLLRREIKSSSWFKTEPLLRKDDRDRFLRGQTIDQELLAESTLELFYPSVAVGDTWHLDSSQISNEGLILIDFSMRPSTISQRPLRVPLNKSEIDTFSLFSWITEDRIKHCQNNLCGNFTVIDVPYFLKSSEKKSGDRTQSGDQLQVLLQAKQIKSFYEFLKQIDFIETSPNSIEFSDSENKIPSRPGGTSPRINGGG